MQDVTTEMLKKGFFSNRVINLKTKSQKYKFLKLTYF